MADKEFCPKCHESHNPEENCEGMDAQALQRRAIKLIEKAEAGLGQHAPAGPYTPPRPPTLEELAKYRSDRAAGHLMLTALQIIKARGGGSILDAIGDAVELTRHAHLEGAKMVEEHPEWFEGGLMPPVPWEPL